MTPCHTPDGVQDAMLYDATSIRFDPRRSAIVVIDVQNDYCSPSGALARLGRDVTEVDATVDNIEILIDAARSQGVPVCFVTMAQSPADGDGPWARRRPLAPPKPATTVCAAGTWGAELYRLVPRTGDLRVEKHRYSAFLQTGLELELRARGRDSLLFCGVATDVCVETSLRDAVCRDFYTTLVEDCCAARDHHAHLRAIAAVRADHGLVASSSSIIDHWAGTAGGR
jgi:nicotinamidase-related amidase